MYELKPGIVRNVSPVFKTSGISKEPDYSRLKNGFLLSSLSHTSIDHRWISGQPDNKNGSENCLVVDVNAASALLADVNCDLPFQYICEVPK